MGGGMAGNWDDGGGEQLCAEEMRPYLRVVGDDVILRFCLPRARDQGVGK